MSSASPVTSAALQQNEVLLDENGFIQNNYRGDQTAEKIHAVTAETLRLIEGLRSENKRACILVDLSGMGKSTAASRKAASESLKLMVYDRVGIYGANIFMKFLANFVIMASGQSAKVRYFNTRAEAEAWLSVC